MCIHIYTYFDTQILNGAGQIYLHLGSLGGNCRYIHHELSGI